MHRFVPRAASTLANVRPGAWYGSAARWAAPRARCGAPQRAARPFRAVHAARFVSSHTPAVAQAGAGDGGGGRSLSTTEMTYVGGLAGSLAAMLGLALAAAGGAGTEDPEPAARADAAPTPPTPAAEAEAEAEAPSKDEGDAASAGGDDAVVAGSEPTVSVVGGSKIVCDRQPPTRVFTLEEVRADHGDEVWVVLSDTRGVYNVT